MTNFLTPRYDGILLLILFFLLRYSHLNTATLRIIHMEEKKGGPRPRYRCCKIDASEQQFFWHLDVFGSTLLASPIVIAFFFLLIWIFFLVFIFDINWLPVMLVYSTSFFGSLTHQREVKLLFETLYFGSKNWDNDKNISDNVMFTNAN